MMLQGTPPSFNAHTVSASTLMFLCGTLFALSVFNRPLELRDETAFGGGVLSGAMGILSITSAPSMIAASLYLEYDSPRANKSMRIRQMSLVGTASFAAFYFGSYAAYYALPGLLVAAVALLGVAFGVFYLIGVELAAVWSSSIGFGIGFAMASFAAGSICASLAFEFGIRAVGVVGALALTATFWVVTSSVCLRWLVWPDNSPDPMAKPASNAGHRLSWPELLRSPPFYLFGFAAFVGQAAYGPLYAYFFSASYEFPGVYRPTSWFAAMQVVGMVARLAGGLLAETVSAKSLLLVFFALQAVMFGLLAVNTSFAGFLVGALLLFVCFNAVASDLAVLCRDLFSPANAATVFGVACGLTMGVGEAFSVGFFSVMDGSFRTYYGCLAALSGLGALAASIIQRESKAFRETLESGEVVLWVQAPAVATDEEKPLVSASIGLAVSQEDTEEYGEEHMLLGSYKAAVVVGSPRFITQSPAPASTPQGFGSVGSSLSADVDTR
eukprot:Plantae.Rhodophyta-Rhodochaete_pulchella.ctg7364.p1 GENE.Plantae.Rhodophyta-Rhodochaete_pulchella.ctg7364~~Plantae.Rhodophyta-Rhodochaete_pulchella.ctg7364.p1  ORF type:complete len:498 (-),score=53.86 Plantae.Rhodophyta-Rhodochaete_pulchella.ctg7364:308-1801(-)